LLETITYFPLFLIVVIPINACQRLCIPSKLVVASIGVDDCRAIVTSCDRESAFGVLLAMCDSNEDCDEFEVVLHCCNVNGPDETGMYTGGGSCGVVLVVFYTFHDRPVSNSHICNPSMLNLLASANQMTYLLINNLVEFRKCKIITFGDSE
jgi:hypothetical protein